MCHKFYFNSQPNRFIFALSNGVFRIFVDKKLGEIYGNMFVQIAYSLLIIIIITIIIRRKFFLIVLLIEIFSALSNGRFSISVPWIVSEIQGNESRNLVTKTSTRIHFLILCRQFDFISQA